MYKRSWIAPCRLSPAVCEGIAQAKKKKLGELPHPGLEVLCAWNKNELRFATLGNQVRSYRGRYLMRFAVDGSELQVDVQNQPWRPARDINLEIRCEDSGKWYSAILWSYQMTARSNLGDVWYEDGSTELANFNELVADRLVRVNHKLFQSIQEFEAMILPHGMKSQSETPTKTVKLRTHLLLLKCTTHREDSVSAWGCALRPGDEYFCQWSVEALSFAPFSLKRKPAQLQTDISALHLS